MFGYYEQPRTAEERRRDQERADKSLAEAKLALGFLKEYIRPLLVTANADVGLAGSGSFGSAELLIEVDDVTYKLTARVDNDD